jgi:hypothetical protein
MAWNPYLEARYLDASDVAQKIADTLDGLIFHGWFNLHGLIYVDTAGSLSSLDCKNSAFSAGPAVSYFNA